MQLTPTERDRLLLFSAAELARRRRAAGVLLNVPEATALIADEVCEVARRGGRHADAVRTGQSVLTAAEVLPEVPYVVRSVAVESVFADGSRLVVVRDPFGPVAERDDMPGAVLVADQPPVEPVADLVTVEVVNTASVVISVTSHFHFFEANARLWFSRATAYGRHLDVPAGTHVRFEPGTTTSVRLAPIRGGRVVVGFAGLVDGPLDEPGVFETAIARAHEWGFLDSDHAGNGDPESAAARAVAR
ncbi:urease subunit gamma [Kribbella sandramycini]|uniref:urease n=1 Tax=Kribbella sandramycini TaxID=60450 RepID=A0A7Y4KX58_9ACTN|nr:urease subunit gamma [Kribbella sandramycini]MBB6569878.1 urease subunit gamma/beta [Kribbella sandramycini]NOL40297.1 urease subunit gamma [Kribbella sandramycini]